MKGYFYHGIYTEDYGAAIELLIEILDEGLLTRSEVVKKYCNEKVPDEILEKYNYICLYKKNNDYDYSADGTLEHSARGGWIDGQFVFIISPDIDARKAELGSETNLVDEWRCFQNIPPTKFVGIALPYDIEIIQKHLSEETYDAEEMKEENRVQFLIKKAQSMGLDIVSSNETNFADAYDNKHFSRAL